MRRSTLSAINKVAYSLIKISASGLPSQSKGDVGEKNGPLPGCIPILLCCTDFERLVERIRGETFGARPVYNGGIKEAPCRMAKTGLSKMWYGTALVFSGRGVGFACFWPRAKESRGGTCSQAFAPSGPAASFAVN